MGSMRPCAGCGAQVESRFRFCPWCAAPQRTKIVDFFRPAEMDAGKALRVSRYLRDGHVRFSVWNEDGTAEAAVSIPDEEAERLVLFLAPPPRARTTVERLRDALHL
jgi:hypothetical protein